MLRGQLGSWNHPISHKVELFVNKTSTFEADVEDTGVFYL
jgi:hypothetical protein